MKKAIREYIYSQVGIDIDLYRTSFSKSWECNDTVIIEYREMSKVDFRTLELLVSTSGRLRMEPVGVWGKAIYFNRSCSNDR